MNSRSQTGPGECLTDYLIADYLEGTLTPVVKAACEVHLISCDACREKLAALMRIIQPDLTPDEKAAVDEVLAEPGRLNVPPVSGIRGWWKRAYTYMAIAAVVVLALLLGRSLLTSPDELISTGILTKYRPFEARLGDQPYLPLNATRGAEEQPNLEILARRTTSASPYERGRLALLAKQYDAAIAQLTPVAADPDASAAVLNDLGVAYLNRSGAGDLKSARQNFEGAIQRDAAFLPALSNLVLLDVVEGLTAEANQKFKRYLELDPDSEWSKELSNRVSPKD